MPPVGRWVDRPDGDGSGSLRAQNHNTTRSNRTSYNPIAGPTGDVIIEWTISTTEFRSRNFNRGRGEGDARTFDASDADRERTYAYLEDDPVVGETFVVSVPSVDFPGINDPARQITPADVVPTATSFGGTGDGTAPKDVLAEMSAFTGISGLTGLTPANDGSSSVLYDAVTKRSGGKPAGPFVVAWNPDRRSGDTDADSVSEPVVARATATLDGGIRLPVMLYARRIRHASDYLFVVGWIVDAGALYADAASLLVDAGPNQVVQVGKSDALGSSVPVSVVESLDSRGQLGSLTFDGPATDDLLPFLPADLREGDGATVVADAARRSSGAGRNPQTGTKIEISASRVARMIDTVDVIRRYLDSCETDVCVTLREHADARHGLLRDATTNLQAGDHNASRRSLLKVRDIVEGDIQRLGAAKDGDHEALTDVAGLEAALLRESALALEPVDDASDAPGLKLAVETRAGGIAGDDDGDGVWDPIDQSAVDGGVSVERLLVDGDLFVDAHTFTLQEGKKGMNAIDVKIPRSDDADGTFTWSQIDGPLAWSVSTGDSGGSVIVTALADPASGEPTNKADLVASIAATVGVSQSHAGRVLDAFVDAAARLHAGIEKDKIKRRMVVTEPGVVGDRTPRTGEEVAIPAFGDGDWYTESELLDAVVVNLDSTLVHLRSSCPDCEYADSWIAGPSAVSTPSLPETVRVLHVDDEPGLAEMSAKLLELRSDRLSVTAATSAAEGLEHLRENRIDCVISDFTMPSMNGLEFLKAVRQDHHNLPFVLFTVRSEEEVWGEARAAGATDHLEKGRVNDQYGALADRIERSVAEALTGRSS